MKFLSLVLLSFLKGADAFSSGAGACLEGAASAALGHGPSSGGLDVGSYVLSVDGTNYAPGDTIDVNTNTEYTIEVSGGTHRGILFRLDSGTVTPLGGLQAAATCAPFGFPSATHSNGSDKESSSVVVSFGATGSVNMDVSILRSQMSFQNYYSPYTFNVVDPPPPPPPTPSPSPQPSVTPTTAPIAPTASPIASPTTAPITPTASPIASPTTAPITPTVAPVATTAAPVAPTVSPVTPTVSPVSPTATPLVATPAPVAETGMPTATFSPTSTFVPTATLFPTSTPLPSMFVPEPLGPLPDVEEMMYSHNGDSLTGFRTMPEDASALVKKPAVIFIPDWDGNNYYEQQRATLAATDLGYIGFAADIYGSEYLEVDGALRSELAGTYRGDPVLFADRIQAAIDFVRTMPEVDGENIAVAGYCFGGTGVLIYALLGYSDVKAVISFHGGLTSLPPANVAVGPKVLVLSGGADDTATEIMDLEETLNTANATWEITRYSDILHGFTNFNDNRYNEFADMRSWESMRHFLKETFGEIDFEVSQPVAYDVSPVTYVDEIDGKRLQSYISFPGPEWGVGPAPCVVIIPDWDGVNKYEKERAQLLADNGYVGFAADIYGADLQEDLSFAVRAEQTGLYRGNMTLFVSRMQRAVDEVKNFPQCDADNIAIIGYCFGGTGVVYYAFSGRDDVKAVVSFHGNTQEQNIPPVMETAKPYTLILSGGEDDAHGNQTFLEEMLNAADADWEITRYSGVFHGFTSWESQAYNLNADVRSFESMFTIFEEFMPVPVLEPVVPEETTSPTPMPTYFSLCTRTPPCIGFLGLTGISLIKEEDGVCENQCIVSWFLQRYRLDRGWVCGECDV